MKKKKEKIEIQQRKREEILERSGALNIQPEGIVNEKIGSYSEKVKNGTEVTEQLKFKSAWANQMSQVSLENQLKLATAAAATARLGRRES